MLDYRRVLQKMQSKSGLNQKKAVALGCFLLLFSPMFFCIASRVWWQEIWLCKGKSKPWDDIIAMKSWLIHRKSWIMDYEMFPEYNWVGFHPPKNPAYIPRLLFGQSFSHKPPFITSSLSSLVPWCLWGKSAWNPRFVGRTQPVPQIIFTENLQGCMKMTHPVCHMIHVWNVYLHVPSCTIK